MIKSFLFFVCLCLVYVDSVPVNKTGPPSVQDPCDPNVWGNACAPHLICRDGFCTDPECIVNEDCRGDRSCSKNRICVDPCVGSCGLNAVCKGVRHKAVCSCPEGYTGSPFVKCDIKPVTTPAPPTPECISDQQCPDDAVCVESRCSPVCVLNNCGLNARCFGRHHQAQCACLPGFEGDADTGCYSVECHSNNDCPNDESCEGGSCVKVCSRVRCGPEAHCVARGHAASCECDGGARGNPWTGCRRSECTVDDDCAYWLACRAGTCQNPCPGACAPDALCSVVRHAPTCECPRGTSGNPKIECHPDGDTRNTFFRKDYKFLEGPQSFYKIHTIKRTWQDAKKRCAMEGATLFYAKDKAEADAVIEYWKNTQPLLEPHVWSGFSDFLSKGSFVTIDGKSINDVYNEWAPSEPNNADGIEDCGMFKKNGQLNDVRCDHKNSFICKKTLDSLEWNSLCNMPDLSYTYNEELGRCYKWHKIPMNWNDAYGICAAKQSYLAIIDNQEEHDFFIKLIDEAPKKVNKNIDYLNGVVHLGFHNYYKEGWLTVKDVEMEEDGWHQWGSGQPDGSDQELCGSMFFNGGLNDVGCQQKCFFICEHEIENF